MAAIAWRQFCRGHGPLLLALALPAHAQADLKTCAAITDSSARLACYDALAAQPAQPAEPAPPAPIPPSPAPAPPKELGARLASAVEDLQKGTQITLDNGQVWKVIENPGGYFALIEAGSEVTVSVSPFGGHRMLIKPIGRTLRVKRLR